MRLRDSRISTPRRTVDLVLLLRRSIGNSPLQFAHIPGCDALWMNDAHPDARRTAPPASTLAAARLRLLVAADAKSLQRIARKIQRFSFRRRPGQRSVSGLLPRPGQIGHADMPGRTSRRRREMEKHY